MDNLKKKIRGTENTKNTSGVTHENDEKNNPGEFPTFDTLENSPEKSKNTFCTQKKVFSPHNNLISTVMKFNGKTIKIKAIKCLAMNKVNGEIYVGVKGIETYGDVWCLSLCDETGFIYAYTTIKKFCIKDVLHLKNCGLWKHMDNTLNILHENLIEIHKK